MLDATLAGDATAAADERIRVRNIELSPSFKDRCLLDKLFFCTSRIVQRCIDQCKEESTRY